MVHRTIIVAISCILFLVSSASAAIYTLTPHISISEEYTDNRNLTDENPIEEYTTTISPGINQSIVGRRVSMNLDYTAGYVQYNETDADPIWNHNATLSFSADLSKHTQLSIADSFTRTDQSVREAGFNLLGYVQIEDELVPVYDTSLRKGRKQYDSNSTSARLTHQFGERDTISFHYSYSFLNELENEYEDNNYKLHRPGFDLTYWLTPDFGVDLAANYSTGERGELSGHDTGTGSLTLRGGLTRHLDMYLSYEYSTYQYDSVTNRDYDLHKPSVGISYQIEKDISLKLGGGYFYQDRNEKDGEGPFADLSIQKTWSYRRGSADLIGLAGLDSNELGTEDLGLRRFYGFGMNASYGLTKRLNAGINASFHRNEHIDTEDDRVDNQGQAGCFLSLTPWRWISIMASYSHRFIKSTLEENDYDENMAQLSVSIHPWTYRN
jgi:hypothetical protein